MRLFGQVIKTRPGWDTPIGSYPYRGVIYNEYGQLVTTEVGGMTEEDCKQAIRIVGQQIFQHHFANRFDFFEIEEEPVENKEKN